MWLTNSSIGRKLVMAVTGACLVLFITFHCLMNAVALLWPSAYNAVCAFLGANWYALIASAGLALLFVIHIIYALWLTLQNRKARGNDRYAVNALQPQVEWSSKNMLVLGIVVVAFLIVHMIQFWARMQLQEILAASPVDWYRHEGAVVPPQSGTLFIQIAFQNWWTPVIYIIGFVALWFHLNHGFWSMFQTIGWNGSTWLPRLKKISLWWTSIVVVLFTIQAIVFTVQANQQAYINDTDLQSQYYEAWQHGLQESDINHQNPEALQALDKDFTESMKKFAPEIYNMLQWQMNMQQGGAQMPQMAPSAADVEEEVDITETDTIE